MFLVRWWAGPILSAPVFTKLRDISCRPAASADIYRQRGDTLICLSLCVGHAVTAPLPLNSFSIFLPLSHPALAGSLPGRSPPSLNILCVCERERVSSSTSFFMKYCTSSGRNIKYLSVTYCRRALHQRSHWCMFWHAPLQLYVAGFGLKNTVCPRYEAIQDPIHSNEASWRALLCVGCLACLLVLWEHCGLGLVR